VGEVLSAVKLICRLCTNCPWAKVYVSCSTIAGRRLADEKLTGLAAGVFYAPLDYRFSVRRVLRMLRPAAVVVMETEIWPNLYREARQSGAALIVVNGRISDRTVARYRRLRWFFTAVLGQADAILAQSERDRERYLAIGAPPERTSFGGNIKFDIRLPSKAPAPEITAFIERFASSAIWMAASTMPPAAQGDIDEDDVVIEAFRVLCEKRPRLMLILVPRRPERFPVAAEKLQRVGFEFARRSQLRAESPAAPVLLLDTIGELSSLFGLADVVFMGGSLAERGGHNILEPAVAGRAIVVGPHMENFQAIADSFLAARAMERIGSAGDLAAAVDGLLEDAVRRAELGERARTEAERERGATGRAAAAIARLHDRKVPHAPPQPLLQPLTLLWRAGATLHGRWRLARRERLGASTVSVGGITMGGAGKTPFVLWLAERLKRQGLAPAILTRGYRRRESSGDVVLAPGESAPVEVTGDEAQIYIRSGVAAVGIGANRVRVGRRMEEKFRPDIFLLDDGFQHRRLARDLDIVLIDALDPFGGGALPPAGRLREPLNALERANLLVITRATPGREFAGLKAELRRWNPRAPILLCRTVPDIWVRAGSGEESAAGTPLAPSVAAFCGLANPDSFWESLDLVGCPTVWRRKFPDHHRYTAAEVSNLEQAARDSGAEALVTTAKDVANLPALPTLPLYWLRIGLEVEGEEELFRRLPR